MTKKDTFTFELKDNMILHEICDQGDYRRLIQILPLIRKRVYDINAPDVDWSSKSPLHIASSKGSLKCCQILLENGAYPTSMTSSGITPGHIAAEEGRLQILQLLFYYGADLNIEDFSREKPIHLAEKYNRKECVEFLNAINDFQNENIGSVNDEQSRT